MRRPIYHLTALVHSSGEDIDLGLFSSLSKAKAAALRVTGRKRIPWHQDDDSLWDFLNEGEDYYIITQREVQ